MRRNKRNCDFQTRQNTGRDGNCYFFGCDSARTTQLGTTPKHSTKRKNSLFLPLLFFVLRSVFLPILCVSCLCVFFSLGHFFHVACVLSVHKWRSTRTDVRPTITCNNSTTKCFELFQVFQLMITAFLVMSFQHVNIGMYFATM